MFAFFMVNALFVMIVFLLQLNKDNLHIKWPLGVKTNITYDETLHEVTNTGRHASQRKFRRDFNAIVWRPFKFNFLIGFFFVLLFWFFSFFRIFFASITPQNEKLHTNDSKTLTTHTVVANSHEPTELPTRCVRRELGARCKGLDRTTQQVCVCLFHVQRPVRIDCLFDAIEQRQNSHKLAIRRPYEYHVQ